MSDNILTVVAAIAAIESITLYLVDGTTKELKTNEYQTKEIIDKVLPNAALGKPTDIVLKEYSIQKNFEENTNNEITFYVVNKEQAYKVFEDGIKFTQKDIQEIIKTGSRDFKINSDKDTIIAHIDNKIIPGMENLEAQFQRANETDSVGMAVFLKRLSKVINKRGHSIKELLNFMKNADLPIAEDGSIVAYKLLYKKEDHFVDCHTRKVIQRVGDYVYMNEELVDLNRRTQCSTGLHIARRDYLKGFKGDVIVICKIAPEAVIAVPYNEPSKVRVAGYHIVAELDLNAMKLLKSNTPMTSDNKAAILLTNILKGNHINIVNHVEITEAYGGNISTTKVAKSNKPKQTIKTKTKAITKDYKEKIEEISPKKIREKMNKIIKEQKLTIPQQAEALFKAFNNTKNKSDFDALLAFKKSKRKSWSALGFSKTRIAQLEKVIKNPPLFDPIPDNTKPTKPLTIKEQAQALWITAKKGDNAAFDMLVALKTKKKKGWKSFGFSDADILKIQNKLKE